MTMNGAQTIACRATQTTARRILQSGDETHDAFIRLGGCPSVSPLLPVMGTSLFTTVWDSRDTLHHADKAADERCWGHVCRMQSLPKAGRAEVSKPGAFLRRARLRTALHQHNRVSGHARAQQGQAQQCAAQGERDVQSHRCHAHEPQASAFRPGVTWFLNTFQASAGGVPKAVSAQ
jgi:hypothetical protein